jgi:hypothetical protein
VKRTTAITLVAIAVAACRPESHAPQAKVVEPPVASPNAIPDAPVTGTLHGLPFELRDARYVVDKRVGYEHTDIKLSAGKSESACGSIAPANSPSVWLRLEGAAPIETKDMRLAPDARSVWSVHYQVFDGDQWTGVGDGTAVLSIREAGPDGRVSGGLAVCFPDDAKSCVSGSFEAQSCPPSIDQPVRGTPPPESIPEKYRLRMIDAGAN